MEKILDGDLVVRGRRRNPNRLGLLRCASVHTQDAVAELWIAIVRRMKMALLNQSSHSCHSDTKNVSCQLALLRGAHRSYAMMSVYDQIA